MSHITFAQQGLAAVKEKHWDEAMSKLTAALDKSQNPSWLVARSKALVGLGRFEDALEDAELAWHVALERNSRPDMMDAQYRRAVAYYRLGRLADADCCCVYAMRIAKGFPAVEDEDPKRQWLDERGRWTAEMRQVMEESKTDDFNIGHLSKESNGLPAAAMMQTNRPHVQAWRQAGILRLQILRSLDALPEDDDARLVKVSLKPERKPYKQQQQQQQQKQQQQQQQQQKKKSNEAVLSSPAAVQTTASTEPRMQEFQTMKTMGVSIFSKGVDASKISVNFVPSSVHLEPVLCPDGQSRALRLSLWADIDPSASTYAVTPNKVELSLVKKTAGKWPQLRKNEAESIVEALIPDKSNVTDNVTKNNDENKPSQQGRENQTSERPSYPTSSRHGPKDWDKIADNNEEDEEEQDVNSFFKSIFKNATAEQQRAMMKSFTESNGTSLSTDWNDVKGRKVETVPPEGMEEKRY